MGARVLEVVIVVVVGLCWGCIIFSVGGEGSRTHYSDDTITMKVFTKAVLGIEIKLKYLFNLFPLVPVYTPPPLPPKVYNYALTLDWSAANSIPRHLPAANATPKAVASDWSRVCTSIPVHTHYEVLLIYTG